MKRIKVLKLFVGSLVVAAGLIIGCSNPINEFHATEESKTPFASQELLEDIAKNDTSYIGKLHAFLP